MNLSLSLTHFYTQCKPAEFRNMTEEFQPDRMFRAYNLDVITK